MRFKKFVKLTGYVYACISLTNFEYEAQRAQLNSWEKQQKPAISETKTIREIDWLYLCRQQFDKFGYETHVTTGNGN